MSARTARHSGGDGAAARPLWATVNYSRPTAERLYIDVRDFSRSNMQFAPHRVPISDARTLEGGLSLDREGFVLAEHRSAVAVSRDLKLLDRDYHIEMAQLIKDMTGARVVLPQRTGLLLRFGERSSEQGSAKPARFAHLDYTTEWARRFVQLICAWEQVELEPYRRFVAYQTWRATSEPPQDNTLALCDGRTVATTDTVEFDVTIGPEHVAGNTFVSRVCLPSDAHRWFYFSELTREEVIIFSAFDSAAPLRINVAHTAVDDPTAPADAHPRASVEARFFAFFD
jgi:hypothetical protein